MLHLGDWRHFPRLTVFLRRAHVVSFRLCHALIHRCVQLVDATDRAFCTGHVSDVTSYDAVASAVTACDDVLVYMVSSEKVFYCQQLRPRLVSVMDYLNVSSSPGYDDLPINDAELSCCEEEWNVDRVSATSISNHDSDSCSCDSCSSDSDHDFGRHILRVRWFTANILFEYAQFEDVLCDNSNSSQMSPTYSDLSPDLCASSSLVDRPSVSPAAKRRR
jgi:hypothetical protein